MNDSAEPSVGSRITVVVLFGGQSTEHAVSCISAGAVMAQLDPSRYNVIPVGITQQGAWIPQNPNINVLTEQLQAQGATMPHVADTGEHVQLVIGGDPGELHYTAGPNVGQEFARADVIFPILHGLNGEDGTIQGLFDLAGVPYVGNGVLASAAGMDKVFTKKLAREAGIPVTPELVLTTERQLTSEEQNRLGLPVFVKPARGGSSIGISKVESWDALAAALQKAFNKDAKVVIESMIYGAEVECGVLQQPGGALLVSVPALLQGTEDGYEGFYGFDAKYVDNKVEAAIPAPIDPEMTKQVQEWSITTFEALGCEGLARVDFFVTDHGPVLNEINTMPGFTPISMYPKMFIETGVAYGELLDTLIARALEHPAH